MPQSLPVFLNARRLWRAFGRQCVHGINAGCERLRMPLVVGSVSISQTYIWTKVSVERKTHTTKVFVLISWQNGVTRGLQGRNTVLPLGATAQYSLITYLWQVYRTDPPRRTGVKCMCVCLMPSVGDWRVKQVFSMITKMPTRRSEALRLIYGRLPDFPLVCGTITSVACSI